ncbi:family 16 glycosylhydrolase [Lutibacter citreus]|uniref:family 16 glycosylhydrolase n=1 Tax=Lutibacter citreus TaxID=2138210 RepID=UPI000DBE5D57|nr:family 16 glycosylhydrolase [Lutibacter citreus]
MKCRSQLFYVLIILICNTVFAQPSAPKGYKWEVVEALTDEFKEFDTSKWSYSLWNYPPPNIMMKSQVSVKNGKLTIKAEKNSDSVRWMRTGRIMSKAQIGYPMYTECSMKASDISAYNTYWLNNGNSENRNEIDICENNANPTNPKTKQTIEDFPFIMQSNIHHAVNGKNLRSPSYASTKFLSEKNKNRNKNFTETYHTMGLYWEDDRKCHWFLDGEYVGFSSAQRKFTLELNLYFGLWSNTWDGFATKESLNDDSRNTMYVDWIHTYKLVKN